MPSIWNSLRIAAQRLLGSAHLLFDRVRRAAAQRAREARADIVAAGKKFVNILKWCIGNVASNSVLCAILVFVGFFLLVRVGNLRQEYQLDETEVLRGNAESWIKAAVAADSAFHRTPCGAIKTAVAACEAGPSPWALDSATDTVVALSELAVDQGGLAVGVASKIEDPTGTVAQSRTRLTTALAKVASARATAGALRAAVTRLTDGLNATTSSPSLAPVASGEADLRQLHLLVDADLRSSHRSLSLAMTALGTLRNASSLQGAWWRIAQYVFDDNSPAAIVYPMIVGALASLIAIGAVPLALRVARVLQLRTDVQRPGGGMIEPLRAIATAAVAAPLVIAPVALTSATTSSIANTTTRVETTSSVTSGIEAAPPANAVVTQWNSFVNDGARQDDRLAKQISRLVEEDQRQVRAVDFSMRRLANAVTVAVTQDSVVTSSTRQSLVQLATTTARRDSALLSVLDSARALYASVTRFDSAIGLSMRTQTNIAWLDECLKLRQSSRWWGSRLVSQSGKRLYANARQTLMRAPTDIETLVRATCDPSVPDDRLSALTQSAWSVARSTDTAAADSSPHRRR